MNCSAITVDEKSPVAAAATASLKATSPEAAPRLPEAQRLTRPFDLLAVGHRLGAEAVRMAKSRTLGAVKPLVRVPKGQGVDGCDVAEDLKGHRPHHEYPRLRTEADAIPVWGEYDVVVVGGGTAGCPAAEAAAEKGAKVLVVEMVGVVGGTQVNGIGYSKGNLSQLRFNQLTEAGCEVWLNTMACGVLKSGHQVRGAVVATSYGRGAVLAKITIDATGDGDLGAWAGAPVMFVNDGDMAVQNTALLSSVEKTTGQNDWNGLPFDPSDLENLTWFYVIRRDQKEDQKDRKGAFDYWPLLGKRETRRILGDNFVVCTQNRIPCAVN